MKINKKLLEFVKKVNKSKDYIYCPLCESNETNTKISLGTNTIIVECIDCNTTFEIRLLDNK